MKNLNKTKQKGYAILFTMIIVGIISTIAIGLANLSYKQLILSSVAKDSQISFYQADIATECGIYADNKRAGGLASGVFPWTCGGILLSETFPSYNQYDLENTALNSTTSPCFRIIIDKSIPPATTIRGLGYNICNKTNIRTVEREIDVSY
jgi:Tfp pilus assembly protein PilX